MEISLYRDTEIGREIRSMPAEVYNLAKRLMLHSPAGAAFVPIRSMQYLAILDQDEFLFIDHQYKSRIEIAWQNFQPQVRTSLQEPVPFEAVIYRASADAAMQRLHGEFSKALQLLEARTSIDGPARVLKLAR